jgi:hypothetical protein
MTSSKIIENIEDATWKLVKYVSPEVHDHLVKDPVQLLMLLFSWSIFFKTRVSCLKFTDNILPIYITNVGKKKSIPGQQCSAAQRLLCFLVIITVLPISPMLVTPIFLTITDLLYTCLHTPICNGLCDNHCTMSPFSWYPNTQLQVQYHTHVDNVSQTEQQRGSIM